MKNAKKYLILIRSLFILFGISFIVGYSSSMIWGVPVIYVGILAMIIQIWGHSVYNYLYEKYIYDFDIGERLKRYDELPFKEYNVELTCEHCRYKQIVPYDLTESIFECVSCHKKNGIHTTIKVAAINDLPEQIKI